MAEVEISKKAAASEKKKTDGDAKEAEGTKTSSAKGNKKKRVD